MQLIRNRPLETGCVLTIGNFDGVHLGHQALLQRVVKEARLLQVPACVLTFSPYPKEFFEGKPLASALPLADKLHFLKDCGIDVVYLLRFNRALSSLTPECFVKRYVIERLQAKVVVVGEDFRFGAGRLGDMKLLKTLLKPCGVPVQCVAPSVVEGRRVSSSWLREALGQGDFVKTKSLMGRPYCLLGVVRMGEKRGRSLGFPTANIYLKKPVVVHGVYSARIHIEGGSESFPAVVNIGNRPTFEGSTWVLEAHLLGVTKDLYHLCLSVEFLEKIREEKKFSSVVALTEQIEKDVRVAKHYFRREQ